MEDQTHEKTLTELGQDVLDAVYDMHALSERAKVIMEAKSTLTLSSILSGEADGTSGMFDLLKDAVDLAQQTHEVSARRDAASAAYVEAREKIEVQATDIKPDDEQAL